MKRVIGLVMAAALGFFIASSFAQAEGEKVLLKVTGNIQNFNSKDKKSFNFTLADLKALGDTKVAADNKYVPGKTSFEGPLLRDVLAKVGAADSAKEMIFYATDGYVVRAPIKDAKDMNVIVGHSNNGKLLNAKEKGPLWIIYPLNDAPKGMLVNEALDKMSWNLIKIEVK